MDYPSAPGEPARIAPRRKPLHPLVPCLATGAVRATQPRHSFRRAPVVAVPSRCRAGGTRQAAVDLLAPTCTHPGGKGPLQCSPRICTGIQTASVRTLSSRKSQSPQTSRRACSLIPMAALPGLTIDSATGADPAGLWVVGAQN